MVCLNDSPTAMDALVYKFSSVGCVVSGIKIFLFSEDLTVVIEKERGVSIF